MLKNKILDFFQLKFFEWISHLLIYHERPEQIAHGHSFVMSNLSDSLMVTHLSWVTWVICSLSLICLEQSEQIAHSCSFDLSKMSDERIPSSGNYWCQNQFIIPFTHQTQNNGVRWLAVLRIRIWIWIRSDPYLFLGSGSESSQIFRIRIRP